jgi:protein gp37
MNNQGKDKIDWTDATLNPVVGCNHGCPYCYARKQAKRKMHVCKLCYEFKPHSHLERLEKLNNKQKAKKIFIDSMWDWNCSSNERVWNDVILNKMRECSQHTFQILSKFPQGYKNFSFPRNVWIGTSIDTQTRADAILKHLKEANASVKFVSFEPLLEEIDVDLTGIDWVIIGANSNRGVAKPPKEWADKLIAKARELGIAVFIKNNYSYPERIKEFPEVRK